MQRTQQQNKALHKFFELKSAQCRDAGVSPKMAFERTIDVEFTPEMMKEVFRAIMKAMYGKRSSTELAKIGEIDDVVQHINRFFAEQFGLEGIELPSYELGYWEGAPLQAKRKV